MSDLHQFLRYLVIGSVVTCTDAVIYIALTSSRAQWGRIPANVFSTTCGMVFGFSLHFVFVFQPTDPQVPVRFGKYILVVACSVYGVQSAVIYVLASVWRAPVRLAQGLGGLLQSGNAFSADFVDRMTGKVLAAIAGVIWNFILFKFFVYA